MADLVRAHPARFPGFIASLPLNYFDESVKGARAGGDTARRTRRSVFSNVNGLPLDDERFFRLFETANRLQCPVLLHPARGAGVADYPGEPKSKYGIWWTFGWPYKTARRCSDSFRAAVRSPAEHTHRRSPLGAMIPYFEGRVGYGLDQFGTRTADEDYQAS